MPHQNLENVFLVFAQPGKRGSHFVEAMACDLLVRVTELSGKEFEARITDGIGSIRFLNPQRFAMA